MPAKSPEVKATEKKIKEDQRIAREAARRERAAQIISGARYIGDFRILDSDAETVLKAALEKFNGNDSGCVTVADEDVPGHLQDNLALESEKLLQYGMVSHYMVYGRSVILNLSTSGRTYFEDKGQVVEGNKGAQMERTEIFISHRTVDAEVADMIKDFLTATGIPNTKVFCSSLPGNDVNEKISPEVKNHLKNATINILILSKDYYESAYCLNEAGVAWYLDEALAIPIGLPEINHNCMVGFLNSDYKLRRLDNDGDIAYLYDMAMERLNAAVVTHSVITRETQKLKERYQTHIAGRNTDVDHEAEASHTRTVTISPDATLLLMYAASDPSGRITYVRSISGDSIGAGKFGFMRDDSAKEAARWKGALEELEQYGFVHAASYKRQVFEVTREGYDAAEKLKVKNPHIDTSVDPETYLSDENYCNQ